MSSDGSVRVYSVGTTSVTLMQTLTPHNDKAARQFGFTVKFTESGKLIVGDPNAPAKRATSFSSMSGDPLTFDGGATAFVDDVMIGKLVVYGNYAGNWMYEQEIENPLLVAAWRTNKLYKVGNLVKSGSASVSV